MPTTLSINPLVRKRKPTDLSIMAQPPVPVNIGNVSSNNNVLIVQLNFVEQMVALANFSDRLDTSGVILDTLTREFRYSADGSSFSGWIALTALNLAAIVHNPGDPIFIQLKYTRNIVDGFGKITYRFTEITGTYNPGLELTQNMIFNSGNYTEALPAILQTVLTAYLKEKMGNYYLSIGKTQAEGIAHAWAVDPTKNRGDCNEKMRGLVYLQSFNYSGRSQYGTCSWKIDGSFVVGTMYPPEEKNYDVQLGFLIEAFNLFNNYNQRFTFEYQSNFWFGVSWEYLGLTINRLGTTTEFVDEKCRNRKHEFLVEFSLTFENTYQPVTS